MILGSKFNLEDRIHAIHDYPLREFVPCPACEGTGRVTLANGERLCPECYGRKGCNQVRAKCWQLSKSGTVGKIEASVTSLEPGCPWPLVTYMLRETGVGSGTIYYEENCYATQEEAFAACNERNAAREAV